jgi:hypothetical protein
MPKYPEFNSKPLKGVKEEDWGKMTVGYFNKKDAQYAKTDYLRFKPELILELAEPFINAQQMIDFVGEDQNDIRSAGRLIQYQKVERPEWFEEIYEGESKEECLQIVLNASSIDDIEQRILNRLYSFYTKEKLRELVPHLWKRRVWDVDVEKDDNYIYDILCTYNTIAEMRVKKIHKTLITKLQVGKEKYPKSYEKYKTMLTQPGNKKGSKRGNYKK